MLSKFKQSWIKMPPKRRKLVAVVTIAAIVFTVIGVFQPSPKERDKQYNRKNDQIRNVLTDHGTRNVGIDNLSGRVKNLDSRSEQLEREVERLTKEAKDKSDASAIEKRLNEKISALSKELEALRKGQSEGQAKTEDPKGNPFEAMTTEDVTYNAKSGAFGSNSGASNPSRKKDAPTIRVFSGQKHEKEREKAERKAKNPPADAEAYIPAGSILTGTIISGGDFATNAGGFENPTPLLVRLSKDAILPNRFRTDIRECFLLMGGRGDLSSERVKLRGEMLSCVRKDGSVIETKLNSYVTGEDGKEGIKGRLVSKQGQIIARSLMAGFASGLSDAFDVNQVPTISTSTDGTVQYSKVYSTDALQGAAIKGLSNSLERISQFYLDMAKDIFPVVEINAGREVDVIVISGTRLKVTAENVRN